MTTDIKSELAFIKGLKGQQFFANKKDINDQVFLYISGVSLDSNARINVNGMASDGTLHVSLLPTYRGSYRTIVEDPDFIKILKSKDRHDFSVQIKWLKQLIWTTHHDY